MKQIIMIGIVGIVAAVLGFAACEIAQPLVHAENTAVAAGTTNTVDTAANTAAIWDTTASDTIHFIQFGCESGLPCMAHHGVVRSYHPRGTAAIVEIVKDFNHKMRTVGLMYVTPSGNVVATRNTNGWHCIQPIAGDAIRRDAYELMLPQSVVLTKDPTACEDMFK